jgi:hypothetical protein
MSSILLSNVSSNYDHVLLLIYYSIKEEINITILFIFLNNLNDWKIFSFKLRWTLLGSPQILLAFCTEFAAYLYINIHRTGLK